MNSAPKTNAWASPFGTSCATYLNVQPIFCPSPNNLWNWLWSSGVVMINILFWVPPSSILTVDNRSSACHRLAWVAYLLLWWSGRDVCRSRRLIWFLLICKVSCLAEPCPLGPSKGTSVWPHIFCYYLEIVVNWGSNHFAVRKLARCPHRRGSSGLTILLHFPFIKPQ